MPRLVYVFQDFLEPGAYEDMLKHINQLNREKWKLNMSPMFTGRLCLLKI